MELSMDRRGNKDGAYCWRRSKITQELADQDYINDLKPSPYKLDIYYDYACTTLRATISLSESEKSLSQYAGNFVATNGGSVYRLKNESVAAYNVSGGYVKNSQSIQTVTTQCGFVVDDSQSAYPKDDGYTYTAVT